MAGQATLTATDLTQIQDLNNQSVHQNDSRLRTFTGNPDDAISWMDDFKYHADANGWNDQKKKKKLGTYLSGAGKEWYSLEIANSQKNWDQTKTSFYEQFLPVGYESHLKQEFRTRKQKLFEPSANYITSMRSVLKKSNQNMVEEDAVDFIMRNMLPIIVEKVMPMHPTSFAQLKNYANLVEQTLKAVQESDQKIMALTEQMNRNKISDNNNGRQNYNRGRGNAQTARDFKSRTKNDRHKCYYCHIPGHVIANRIKRMSNESNNYSGRGRGGGYRGRGYNNRGNRRYNGFRNFGNRNAGIHNAEDDEQEVHL